MTYLTRRLLDVFSLAFFLPGKMSTHFSQVFFSPTLCCLESVSQSKGIHFRTHCNSPLPQLELGSCHPQGGSPPYLSHTPRHTGDARSQRHSQFGLHQNEKHSPNHKAKVKEKHEHEATEVQLQDTSSPLSHVSHLVQSHPQSKSNKASCDATKSNPLETNSENFEAKFPLYSLFLMMKAVML